MLCVPCWSRIHFFAPPNCDLCGLPFEFELGAAALCAPCAARRPGYDRARAVFSYDDASKGLVLGFKHGDRTEGAGAFGLWLSRAGADFKDPRALIVPVPLHWSRLALRRYNQAALLARALHEYWGEGALCLDLLVRRRATPPQGRLSTTQRGRNVRGAFAVNRRRAEMLRGRRIVLVDDVMTTGATVEAATATLKRAGAGAVDVLVLARALISAR